MGEWLLLDETEEPQALRVLPLRMFSVGVVQQTLLQASGRTRQAWIQDGRHGLGQGIQAPFLHDQRV